MIGATAAMRLQDQMTCPRHGVLPFLMLQPHMTPFTLAGHCPARVRGYRRFLLPNLLQTCIPHPNQGNLRCLICECGMIIPLHLTEIDHQIGWISSFHLHVQKLYNHHVADFMRSYQVVDGSPRPSMQYAQNATTAKSAWPGEQLSGPGTTPFPQVVICG